MKPFPSLPPSLLFSLPLSFPLPPPTRISLSPPPSSSVPLFPLGLENIFRVFPTHVRTLGVLKTLGGPEEPCERPQPRGRLWKSRWGAWPCPSSCNIGSIQQRHSSVCSYAPVGLGGRGRGGGEVRLQSQGSEGCSLCSGTRKSSWSI